MPRPDASFAHVAPFVDGAADVAVGQYTGPIKSQFGWHIIRVDDRAPLTFADVSSQLTQYVSQKANDALTEVLTEGAKGRISVSPRYGRWDAAQATVVPPGSPSTTTTAVVPTTAAG